MNKTIEANNKGILMLGVILVVLAVACLAMAGAASAADDSGSTAGNDNVTIVNTESELKAAVDAGGNVKLGETIYMNHHLDVSREVTLDLNGKELRFKLKNHIYVYPNGDFVINDSSIPSTGKIMGGYTGGNGGGIYIMERGKVTLNNGSIQDCEAYDNGGGIFVLKGGEFVMNGGEIKNNLAKTGGGGVYINGGSFTMTGGEIHDNKSKRNSGGGVVLLNDAKFTMTGGSIYANEAHESNILRTNGGGVYVNGSTFEMSGNSRISNNSCNKWGGNVFVKNGTFTMSGNSSITHGSAYYGGGVYLESGMFTMNSGTISDNYGCEDGGGVYMKGGTFTMTGGTIEKNEGDDEHGKVFGGGVCVDGGAFNLNGGVIQENKVKSGGGGVMVRNGATISISGHAQILKNTKMNERTASNLCLSGGKLVLSGPLSGDIHITQPEPKAGYQFGTAASGASGAEYFISEDKTLHGSISNGELIWTGEAPKSDTCLVVFNAQNHGVTPDSQTLEKGSTVAEPDGMSEAGYEFLGWYTDAECNENHKWDFAKDTVSEPLTTLYAKWEEKTIHKVEFYDKLATVQQETQYVNDGMRVKQPTVPFSPTHKFNPEVP